MTRTNEWQGDFPMQEQYEDSAGRERTFTITCDDVGLGFTLQAVELTTGEEGYVFRTFSETNPYSGLGKLRDKIRRHLSTRHITGSPGDYSLLHNVMIGRISRSDEDSDAILVVDGKTVTMDNLASILSTHEGWEFELRIVSGV